jgi:hypothetical protein
VMEEVDWMAVFFGLGFLVLATIITVVVLTQVGSYSRARIARRQEDRFRELGERYEALARSAADHQERATAELAEIRERLSAIEKILREVE